MQGLSPWCGLPDCAVEVNDPLPLTGEGVYFFLAASISDIDAITMRLGAARAVGPLPHNRVSGLEQVGHRSKTLLSPSIVTRQLRMSPLWRSPNASCSCFATEHQDQCVPAKPLRCY